MLSPSSMTSVVFNCIFSACISVQKCLSPPGHGSFGGLCAVLATGPGSLLINAYCLSSKKAKKQKGNSTNYQEQRPVLYFYETPDWLDQVVNG